MMHSSGSLKALADRFRADRRAATAIEYSVIAAGIAGVVVLTVYALGSAVDTNLYGALLSAWK